MPDSFIEISSHPINHNVQIVFEQNYFTTFPYMQCRICDKRIYLENRGPLETQQLVSNSWGKEHIVIHHQKELEIIINDKMKFFSIPKLQTFINLHKKLTAKISDEDYLKTISLLNETFFDELEEGISECKTCKLLFLHDETLYDHMKTHLPSENHLLYFFPRPLERCVL